MLQYMIIEVRIRLWGDIMLRRKAYEKLMQWKQEKEKRALCIIGARQIGKTTLVRQFAKEQYDCFVELNFLMDEKASQIFAEELSAERIITNLTAYVRQPLEPGKTLILLDEVQECPNARTAIKFLVEDGRFDYIEIGSQLGVRYKEVRSYPVGFEEVYEMYPMDFEEYAWANGVQPETMQYLQQCFQNGTPVSDSVHNTMLKLFYSYVVVGGMPQVVQTYVDTYDIGKVIDNQNAILALYRLDIAKYARDSDKIKIRMILDAIPAQLNDKNRRFVLNGIDKNGRQNRYANSFEWLTEAGVALPCYNVNEPQPPLQLNAKRNLFKLYMGDTGLLCAACMENIQFALLMGNLEINMGSILENCMAQMIKANRLQLHYFDSKKYGEIDFVVQRGMKVDLLEIKSGNDYKKHHALDKVAAVENWTFDKQYVFCKGNIEQVGDVLYLPWYMVQFYTLPQHTSMQFKVDLSGL